MFGILLDSRLLWFRNRLRQLFNPLGNRVYPHHDVIGEYSLLLRRHIVRSVYFYVRFEINGNHTNQPPYRLLLFCWLAAVKNCFHPQPRQRQP